MPLTAFCQYCYICWHKKGANSSPLKSSLFNESHNPSKRLDSYGTAGATGRSKTSGLSGATWPPLFVDFTVFLFCFFFLRTDLSDCATVSGDATLAFGPEPAASMVYSTPVGASFPPPGRPTSSITAYTAARNAIKVSVATLRRRVVLITAINQIVQEV